MEEEQAKILKKSAMKLMENAPFFTLNQQFRKFFFQIEKKRTEQ